MRLLGASFKKTDEKPTANTYATELKRLDSGAERTNGQLMHGFHMIGFRRKGALFVLYPLIPQPAILYFGTPVALIATENEDGAINVAPNSSIFWLGWSCMIGIDASSKTTENLLRTKTCVINFPSFDLAPEINALSLLTGCSSVPVHKKLLGYQYAKNKLDGTRLSFIELNRKNTMRIS